MERQQVSSTNIASVGFDAGSSTLEIEFHSGGIYQYFGVPEHVYMELVTAPSVGSYFARNIKGVYPYRQI